MKTVTRLTLALLGATALVTPAFADDDKIIVGFATAESGFMQGYDKPAQDAAMIRIKEINEAGGLLGKQIEVVTAECRIATGRQHLENALGEFENRDVESAAA